MPEIGDVRQGQEIGHKWPGKFMWAACEGCGKQRWVALLGGTELRARQCHSCAAKKSKLGVNTRGANNVNWKGGKRTDSKGYVLVKLYREDFFYQMTNSWDYVMEHRIVMARHLGRCLWDWERVHHKNGIKSDNRIENLELTTNAAHITDHHKGYKDGYRKGLADGRLKQIEELKNMVEEQSGLIKLLQWQMKEYGISDNERLREAGTSLD